MERVRATVIESLTARLRSYADLIAQVDDAAIQERLEPPKHKSLGEHLWCVIGARESYAKALRAGAWSGFSCSMEKFERADFVEKLGSSSKAVLDAIASIDDWTDATDDLLMNLAEHEVMHEGQIIRHMYGLERELPHSLKWA